MTTKQYIEQEIDLLDNNITTFIEGAIDCLSIKNFDELIHMLRNAGIDNVDTALDSVLYDSIEFYVRYIFDNEGKTSMSIDEFVEKVMIPQKTHLSKTHDELVDWIVNNTDKLSLKLHLTYEGIYISR